MTQHDQSESPWSAIDAVAVATGDCHDPALAVTSDAVHLVWIRDRLIHHARCVDGMWQSPTRVASGEQPVLAAGPDGILHCLFANWFLGNCEIYHLTFNGARWSFPELVSRTPGVSRNAAMTLDGEAKGHIVWDDDTPGYHMIYAASRGQVAWLHAPVPNVTGTRPTVAITPSGELHVAWQEQVMAVEDGAVIGGSHQVLSCVLADGMWSLPELVSENRTAEAVAPVLAAGPGGDVHIVWQEQFEGRYLIKYAARLASSWSTSGPISDGEADARLPHVYADADGVHVLWAEGAAIQHRTRASAIDAPWDDVETVALEPELSEMAAALGPSGDVFVIWSAYEAIDRRCIRYTKRDRPTEHKIWMPVIGGGKQKK